MSLTRLKAALQRTQGHATITARDVATLRTAVLDGGLDVREAAALREFRARLSDRFDPAAARALAALLGEHPPAMTTPAAPAPTTTTPAAPAAVDWSHFGVASTRAAITGEERDEGLATFDALAPAVAAGTLTKKEQLVLSSATARIGVLGEAQAIRAVATLARLPAADAAAFRALEKTATSPLAQAFLWKGLGAGHTLAELTAFERTTHGWSDAKLMQGLNLADPLVDDGTQTGVKQQFFASCVITTGQALRGEVDPLYALEVRTANSNVHDVDDADPYAKNRRLAEEQFTQLDTVGGYATPRAQMGGVGVSWTKIDDVYNQRAPQTGFVYSSVHLDEHPELTTDTLLDQLGAQLRLGIPSPVLVGDAMNPKCHAMIALETQGTGPQQRFLLHDPWSGDTTWVTRQQFDQHAAPLGPFTSLGGIHLASPAPSTPIPPLAPPAASPGPAE